MSSAWDDKDEYGAVNPKIKKLREGYLLHRRMNQLEEKMERYERQLAKEYSDVWNPCQEKWFLGPQYSDGIASSAPQVDPVLDDWEEQVEYFDSVRMELVKDEAMLGKYVAVKNRKVIDSDDDEAALLKRIDSQFPNDVVLIEKVALAERVVNLPSPRVLP